MKTVLIGSSSERYKGGIAHFTSCLAEELKAFGETLFVSWYRLYPPFLSSRDFRDKVSKLPMGSSSAEFLLGYLNPFSWIATALRIRRFKPDKVIFSWVHPVHAPVYIALILMIKLRNKAEIILQCHNVSPHETFPGARALSRIVFGLSDRLTVHSSSEKEKIQKLLPRKTVIQLFHPIYRFPDPDTTIKPRDDGILKMLFFGVIREYKGLDLLLDALKIVIKTNTKVHLTVSGEAFEVKDNQKISQMVDSAGLSDFVTLDIRYVPNEEVAGIMRKADVVVLPYRSATSSGPLTVAYGFGKPVIATRVGGLPDFVEHGKSGYLCEASAESIAQAILKYAETPLNEEDVQTVAAKFSWQTYANLCLNS